MNHYRPAVTILFAAVLLAGVGLTASPQAGEPKPPTDDDKDLFPDFGFKPSAEQFKGHFFRLRQNYPKTEPPADKRPKFLDIPFNENGAGKQNWKKYLLAVRGYCFEGNANQTPPPEKGQLDRNWDLEKNDKRDWYHAPWQHWDHAGRAGREGINGLTREATSQPGQLAPTQTSKFQTYAVGFYNEFGGYTIGRVWRNHRDPDPSADRFPVGTVVCKLLFTQATAAEVPYLDPPVELEAYAETSDDDHARKVQRLRRSRWTSWSATPGPRRSTAPGGCSAPSATTGPLATRTGGTIWCPSAFSGGRTRTSPRREK